jgi:hypothetical protein
VGFADNLDSAVGEQQGMESLPDDCVIVSQQCLDGLHGFILNRRV